MMSDEEEEVEVERGAETFGASSELGRSES